MPEHFAPLYAKKPRARVMLQRQALLELGGSAASFVAELSRRQRTRLAPEITVLYALYERFGGASLLSVMAKAEQAGIYRAEYLGLLLEVPRRSEASEPMLPAVPPQSEVDRLLSSYEEWVVGAESASVGRADKLVGVA